jgi:hypothetical protein
VSNRVEIHEMSMEGGVMKMRPVAGRCSCGRGDNACRRHSDVGASCRARSGCRGSQARRPWPSLRLVQASRRLPRRESAHPVAERKRGH